MEKATILLPRCYHVGYETTIPCYIEICRNEFRSCTYSLNKKIKKILIDFKSLIESNFDNNPKKIILNGLGSKILTINEIINECFPNVPIVDLSSDKKVIEGLTLYLGKYNGLRESSDILLLDIFGYNIILKGEEFYYNKHESMPSFNVKERMSELNIITKNCSIPTEKKIYFGITKNQCISIIVASINHRDKIVTHNLNISENSTIYEFYIDIDSYKRCNGYIKDIKSQNIVCNFDF